MSKSSADPPTSSKPLRVNGLRGRVVLAPYAAGSKSQREAVFLETPDARYLLRRKGGAAMGDDTLLKFINHGVACDGFVVGTTLLAERITPTGD